MYRKPKGLCVIKGTSKRRISGKRNVVFVGRGTIWKNPFKGFSPIAAAVAYELMLVLMCNQDPKLFDEFVAPLRGKHLACDCKANICHADVLMEYANGGD